jgi:hypothetical protein
MRNSIAALFALVSSSAFAVQPLVADVISAGADKCVYTRGTVATESDVVVDTALGNAGYGFRICRIDLNADPRTGTVYLHVRNSFNGAVSAKASYTFPPAPSTPANVRQAP